MCWTQYCWGMYLLYCVPVHCVCVCVQMHVCVCVCVSMCMTVWVWTLEIFTAVLFTIYYNFVTNYVFIFCCFLWFSPIRSTKFLFLFLGKALTSPYSDTWTNKCINQIHRITWFNKTETPFHIQQHFGLFHCSHWLGNTHNWNNWLIRISVFKNSQEHAFLYTYTLSTQTL